MKTRVLSFFIGFFVMAGVFAQSNLNNYKYVIVPKKFDFLKEKNQYRLNELAQFLFEKYGFKALMEGSEYPNDLKFNRCLSLRSDVIKEPGMFKTKLKAILTDCNDQTVYTSDIGESREKEYKTAYNVAMRECFKSFQSLNYKYEPKEEDLIAAKKESKSEVVEEINKLKAEIETLKAKKEVKKAVETIPKVVAKETVVIENKTIEAGVKEVLSNVLYAQEIENGFQLVDSSPKVVYKIKSTTLKDVYLVENQSAIVSRKGDAWVIEYYEGNVLKHQELNIKF